MFADLRVAVLAYSRPWVLRHTLGALREQIADDRIHVVFDGEAAAIACAATVREVMSSARQHVVYRRDTTRGVAGLRNIALMQAVAYQDCDRILYLDEDIIVAPGAVAAHRRLGATPIIGAGLRSRMPALQLAAYQTPEALFAERGLPYSGDDDRFRTDTAWRKKRFLRVIEMLAGPVDEAALCHSFQISYPTQQALLVGGFWPGTEYREDQEFAERLCRVGCKAQLLDAALSYHIDHAPGGTTEARAAADAAVQWSHETEGVLRV